jgi:hypothetical protein
MTEWKTIRAYAMDAFSEGMTADQVWRGARSIFPGKIVGWGHILNLRREHTRKRAMTHLRRPAEQVKE